MSRRMPAGPHTSARAHGDRPVDEARFAAAVDLVTSSSASFRRTARRFSLCPDDAEDAYQRSLEILLTRAPAIPRDELRRWLHTVIKHEALAVRAERERCVSGDEEAAGARRVPAGERAPDEAATHRERVHRSAEALRALKPGELQCLILKALGYSYDEISERTGFSWTKVNRSLTEGRRRFFERFGEIASGSACRRYEPLLSAACDGHTAPDDERHLRAHLAACSGCRAALREFRTAPARLAELLPPAVVLTVLDRPGVWSRVSDWFAVTAGERATTIGLKLQQGAEVVSAQKAAAVVASTAAIAGGGVAVHNADPRDVGDGGRVQHEAAERTPAPTTEPRDVAVDQTAPAPEPPPAAESAQSHARSKTQPQPSEFGFEDSADAKNTTASGPAEHRAATATASATPTPAQEFSGPGEAAPPRAGGGEFGP